MMLCLPASCCWPFFPHEGWAVSPLVYQGWAPSAFVPTDTDHVSLWPGVWNTGKDKFQDQAEKDLWIIFAGRTKNVNGVRRQEKQKWVRTMFQHNVSYWITYLLCKWPSTNFQLQACWEQIVFWLYEAVRQAMRMFGADAATVPWIALCASCCFAGIELTPFLNHVPEVREVQFWFVYRQLNCNAPSFPYPE